MTRYIYIGGSTQTDSGHRPDGIHVFRMDPADGKLIHVQAVESGPNPTFLALSADRRLLFTVNETEDGAASAFRVDPATGKLEFLNRAAVGGSSPCFLCPEPGGRWLLTANYSSGSLSVLEVESSGRLGALVQVVTHGGSSSDPRRVLSSRDEQRMLAEIQLPDAGSLPEGVRPERQEQAHAHCVMFDPSWNYVLAADLGQDRVWVYRQGADGRLSALSDEAAWNEYGWIGVDPNEAVLKKMSEGFGKPRSGHSLRPGAGPRHLAFHPNGKFLYVSTELASTAAVFRWDAGAGELRPVQEISTLPEGYAGGNDVAHLAFAPDGRFLYVSNRGHNSLAAFSVDSETGLLEPAGHFSTQGRWPRNFCITPDGRFVLAANQESDSVSIFRLDPRTGAPEAAGEIIQVYRPMFVTAVDF